MIGRNILVLDRNIILKNIIFVHLKMDATMGILILYDKNIKTRSVRIHSDEENG